LTTPSIIDISNSAFEGGEIYKTAIKSFRKGGDEKETRTLKKLFSTTKEGDYEGI
jgi:hypothetical protein